MTWRDVLDTDKKDYGHIAKALETAKSVGYKAFTWNGWVWLVTDDGAERTPLLVALLG